MKKILRLKNKKNKNEVFIKLEKRKKKNNEKLFFWFS